MDNTFIKIENVSFAYGSKPVLKDISLDVRKGEFVAVIGYNGSGKSTLAKLINGILLPTSGRVVVDGMDTSDQQNLSRIRRKVGMVFQNPDNQIVATIVEEDVAFAPENLGVASEEIDELVTSAIDTVGLNKHRFDAPHKLSGGQKQRVAIAGVLAMQPECIILDEPTAMLDPKGRQMVNDVIRKLNDSGITVILITHFMEEAATADRVLVLADGAVELSGAPVDVFSRYEKLYELGVAVPAANELCRILNGMDKRVPSYPVTNGECVEALDEYLGGGR